MIAPARLAEIAAIPEAAIDLSDIPEVGERFFAAARLHLPAHGDSAVTTPAPKTFDPPEFGVAFHTALRKFSDTGFSVLLWNLIRMLADDPVAKDWSLFCTFGAGRLNEGASVREIAAEWTQGFDNATLGDRRPISTVFAAALRLMDDETVSDLDGAFKAWRDAA